MEDGRERKGSTVLFLRVLARFRVHWIALVGLSVVPPLAAQELDLLALPLPPESESLLATLSSTPVPQTQAATEKEGFAAAGRCQGAAKGHVERSNSLHAAKLSDNGERGKYSAAHSCTRIQGYGTRAV